MRIFSPRETWKWAVVSHEIWNLVEFHVKLGLDSTFHVDLPRFCVLCSLNLVKHFLAKAIPHHFWSCVCTDMIMWRYTVRGSHSRGLGESYVRTAQAFHHLQPQGNQLTMGLHQENDSLCTRVQDHSSASFSFVSRFVSLYSSSLEWRTSGKCFEICFLTLSSGPGIYLRGWDSGMFWKRIKEGGG